MMESYSGLSGLISRRGFLRVGATAFAATPILQAIQANAGRLRSEGRACILVWLAGAPSQFETWDPKPGVETGGETKAIASAASGIQIAQYWPRVARVMKHASIIRSVAGKEAAHDRGTYHLHTGRRLGGADRFPNFGSIVAEKYGDSADELPAFVSIGQTVSSGFLGVSTAPFIIDRAGQLPANVVATVGQPRTARRLALLSEQDKDFAAAGAEELVDERKTLYERSMKLMKSPHLAAFRTDKAPAKEIEAYGKTPFSTGLLVARQLVEAGVSFVEVRHNGWDMHNSIYDRIKKSAPVVDRGLAQLIQDLRQRGMLERTLVLCLGEFGRTPKLNVKTPKPGRDHWSKNFSVLAAGGGIRGGQVVGATDKLGQEITERPVSVDDLFRTWCSVLKIDADEELMTPAGRPLRIVDAGEPIAELL